MGRYQCLYTITLEASGLDRVPTKSPYAGRRDRCQGGILCAHLLYETETVDQEWINLEGGLEKGRHSTCFVG
jgi:hypothetical protein